MSKPGFMVRQELQPQLDAAKAEREEMVALAQALRAKVEELDRQLANLEEFEAAALDFMACMDLNWQKDAATAYKRMAVALKARGHRDRQ